jgi:hypothetical protein
MSTKELYEAHALITKNKRINPAYNVLDEAIEQYIIAERHLQSLLKDVASRQQLSAQQIYRERFKTVICKVALQPYKDVPVIPDGSEMEQLQFLADYHGCPRANWQ